MRASLMLAVVLITLLTLAGSAFSEEPPRSGHVRAIVVLQENAKEASRVVTEEAATLGGRVEADLGGRLILTAPAPAIETLRRHPAVKYIQRAVAGVPSAEEEREQARTMAAREAPIDSHTGQTWTSGQYLYDGAGNIASIGTAEIPGTQGHRTYGYDAVTRLTKAQVSGVSPGGTWEYSYDEYGNRTGGAIGGGWYSVAVNAATNQLDGAVYDKRGNQVWQGATSATYDGFDMVTSYRYDWMNVESYVYTASDERIGVLRGTEWTWSLRDDGGRVLRQYRSSSTQPAAAWLWVEDFVYREGLLLGSERVAEEGGRRHYHLDHLGSPRLVTGVSGSVISEHDFLPFGEERTTVGQHLERGFDREEPLRFTGHERGFDITEPNDSSSYVDYMHARYYTTRAGRFFSPDPVLGNLLEPQSWNRYAYVSNNPVNFVDPFGLKPVPTTGPHKPDWCQTELCEEVEGEVPRGMALWLFMRWLADPVGRRHPVSHMTLAEHGRAAELGVTEFVDGVIPGLDADESDYGGDMVGLEYSEMVGGYTRDIEIMIASAGAGSQLAGARTAGREFSHWIPDRVLKRTGSRWVRRTFGRSLFNGKYVTRLRHYKHDPFRYPAGWRGMGPRYNPALRQLDRVPGVYSGIGLVLGLRGLD